MEQRQLFGGAITCNLPLSFRDVSQLREVPDNQECWLDLSVEPAEAAMVILEILERQETVPDSDAAHYFFQDLAETNECDTVDSVFCNAQLPLNGAAVIPSLAQQQQQQPATVCLGSGYQRVAVGRNTDSLGNPRQQKVRMVHVDLGVIRLPQQGTDILITLSTPSESNPQQDGDPLVSTPGMSNVFQQIISSFNIRDWGLFVT